MKKRRLTTLFPVRPPNKFLRRPSRFSFFLRLAKYGDTSRKQVSFHYRLKRKETTNRWYVKRPELIITGSFRRCSNSVTFKRFIVEMLTIGLWKDINYWSTGRKIYMQGYLSFLWAIRLTSVKYSAFVFTAIKRSLISLEWEISWMMFVMQWS